MVLAGLINKQISALGALALPFSQLDPNTIQHADEINNDRRDNESLMSTGFYTADHVLYTVEDGEAIIYVGRRETNPTFKNIQEATHQTMYGDHYVPEKDDIEAVVNAVSTLRFKLSELNLDREGDFDIDTIAYEKLNDAQRAFAERIYGQGNDFAKNMNMLNKEGINVTRVRVLNPHTVKDKVEEGRALARACFLENVDGSEQSNLVANWSAAGDISDWIRGVPSQLEKAKTAMDAGNAFRYHNQLYVPVADGTKILE